MPTPDKITEPILIKNPISGRYVNVAPLFNTLAQMDGKVPNKVSNLASAVEQAIRFINLNCDSDTRISEQKNVVLDLYELKDMFGAMTECS